ncbi:TPA: hypothetical protein MA481_002510 [Klebsiella pneumoniae subsp. pneumoniae]|uniref:hypothetical protein n=1 Tax=Klebsiella pneumoniae complex TaxID=3390273 RepID=UPI0011E567A9|nr:MULTISPECIES: hypothetical protein [Klebsiella]MDL4076038.1 hypothetical protein [Klebsiella quasipneumoniae]HBT2409889.1 hypothetical protein [Klebsiella pneumoniae subsp. pneumoniae]HBZ7662220.1 hypothetical protein [Klebsiella variicola subsp. variicola]HCB1356654.1 hypothetical protein [Klebsiella variicola subsp. variicola]
MTFEDAYIELCKGNLISGRFSEGEYVSMTNGIMTLFSPSAEIKDWTPSNSDRLSEEWDLFEK